MGKPGLVLAALALLVFSGSASPTAAQTNKPDPFEPVSFLIGEWKGVSDGQAGMGTVTRSYSFVLNRRFIHERNISTYPPQPANKKGEVHEHWSFISYDTARSTLVLRQFHQESFVVQYILNKSESGPAKLVFESERFENFDNGWKARETYTVSSADQFVETFELAEPGKDFQIYSRNTFKRAKP